MKTWQAGRRQWRSTKSILFSVSIVPNLYWKADFWNAARALGGLMTILILYESGSRHTRLSHCPSYSTLKTPELLFTRSKVTKELSRSMKKLRHSSNHITSVLSTWPVFVTIVCLSFRMRHNIIRNDHHCLVFHDHWITYPWNWSWSAESRSHKSTHFVSLEHARVRGWYWTTK